MTASSSSSTRQRVAIDRIAIPGNVRELDSEHVDALAASIKLRGLLVAGDRPPGSARTSSSSPAFTGSRRTSSSAMEYIDVDVRDAQTTSTATARSRTSPHADLGMRRLMPTRTACRPAGEPLVPPGLGEARAA